MPETTTVKLDKIGVILLGIADVSKSLAFYRDRLGMSVQFSNEAFAFLSAGGVTLGLSKELAKVRTPVPGATEIVFSVSNVHEAYAALKGRGVAFNREPRIIDGTNWAANFLDPDGHQLSLFGPPGGSS